MGGLCERWRSKKKEKRRRRRKKKKKKDKMGGPPEAPRSRNSGRLPVPSIHPSTHGHMTE